MLLTEERASRMIAEWMKDVKLIYLALPTTTSATPFTHSRMVIACNVKLETIQEAIQHARSLRRALGGQSALAVCNGFDPEENPAFWRREMKHLTDRMWYQPLQRLWSDLFSRYDVISKFDEDDTPSVGAYEYFPLGTTTRAMDPRVMGGRLE